MILIVGASGYLGGAICRQLVEQDHTVRALVRSYDSDKTVALQALGVETLYGDLKDPASLKDACLGVTTVISTASATLSRLDGDSIDSVDRQGQINLIDAAQQAGVQQFIFISFPPIERAFPLQAAKRTAEAHLQNSGMTYTLVQPVHFREIWLGAALGFDLAANQVRVFGDGHGRIHWIALDDVRDAVVASVANPSVFNRVLVLTGPEALSQHEVIARFEQYSGRYLTQQTVTHAELEAMYASDDPLQQSFAVLMVTCSSDQNWSPSSPETWDLLGLKPRGFEAFIRESLAALSER